MPEKKKTLVSKSQEKRFAESASAKAPDGARGAAFARAGAASPPLSGDGHTQLSAFEAAMRHFHARRLGEARDLFALATQGPERDVAQRSRLHIAMCDRRLEQPDVSLRSAEDYYNYGIALLNARNVTAAREHLQMALRISPGAEHVHYALGVAQALAGDYAGALENLRRAIELEPRNRLAARQDADLAPLLNQPPFDSLLRPEKKAW
jgi:tetratricopeptide (TPR) repeat protein